MSLKKLYSNFYLKYLKKIFFEMINYLFLKKRTKFVCLLMLLLFLKEAPPSHDILVFMTGQEEIEALARTCRDISKHLPETCAPMTVVPLYASLPPTQQLRVFQPAPKVTTPNATTHLMLNLHFHSLTHTPVCDHYRDPGK